MKMKIKDIVLIGMMSAMMFAIQVAMAILPLPNVELTSLLVIVFALVFGYKALFIIYIFVLLEGIFYGFHIWWVNYLYVWTVLFFVARLFRRKRSSLFWAVISGVYGSASEHSAPSPTF
jgi:energy-coupling factor transport system substrate-specific component